MAKRSWPLLLLALAAFMPGIGFLCAAIAVVWGLLSDQSRARLAVGLGAAGALLQLAVGFGLVLWLLSSSTMHEAKIRRAASDLSRLVAELNAYRAEAGTYPPTLSALVAQRSPQESLSAYDPTAGLFRLQPYIYRSVMATNTFDLFAVGPDGRADTPDDTRPELPNSVMARTGYRPAR